MAWWRRWPSLSLAQLVADGFVALDLETTGLNPRRDAIVSLAAIPFVQGQPQPGFRTLVNPGRPIPPAATHIHGLDDAAVASGPPIAEVLPRLAAECDGRVLVGYAIDFDLAVLKRDARACTLRPLRNHALDARDLALGLGVRGQLGTLESLAERLGVPVIGRHTASGDAIIAGLIVLELLRAYEARGVQTVAELLQLQRSTRSPRYRPP